MNEKQLVKADFITSIVLLVFSITVTWMAVNMPRFEEKNINPYSAPGVVPAGLGVVIFLLALVMLVRSIRRSGFLPRVEKGKIKGFLRNPAYIRLIITFFLCLFYAVVLIGRIPYPVATFLFIITFILSFELKFDKAAGTVRMIIIKGLIEAVAATAVISFVFQYLFLVDLP